MNIAVIFGGESCEHDISIITGVQLISKINEYLYNVIPIYIDKKGKWFTGKTLNDIDNFPNYLGKLTEVSLSSNDNNLYIKKKNKLIKNTTIDFAFVCMHGQRGEDGSIAGLLELAKIPYSSSSMMASSVAMDKVAFKVFLQGLDISTIDSRYVFKSDYELDSEYCTKQIDELGYPIIIKPSRQGSSIGIKVCRIKDDLKKSLDEAFLYDDRLLIEKYVSIKKEVNIALFKHKKDIVFSSTEEPVYKNEILGFDEKYRKNSGGFETIKRIMPADISDSEELLIKKYSKGVYELLDMFGVVRFDYIIDDKDNLFLNEVNAIPGSMANYLFKSDLKYEKLIEDIMLNGLVRKENADNLLKTFESDVLAEGFNGFKK